jgi:hypothetical protein
MLKLTSRRGVGLYYFEDILPAEFVAINERRRKLRRTPPVAPLRPETPRGKKARRRSVGLDHADSPPPRPSPDPKRLFPAKASRTDGRSLDAQGGVDDPDRPDPLKMRPRPVPCTATGLALSGGGIRSAAVSLGALQALQSDDRLKSFDYLSTVSGGGYVGACYSALTKRLPPGAPAFGDDKDVADNPAVGHLRNYSNYLLPRGRSSARNFGEAAAVILRGLVANAVIILSFVLLAAALTLVVRGFSDRVDVPMEVTGAALGVFLLLWALARSAAMRDWIAGDTSGLFLSLCNGLLIACLVLAFVALQPAAIRWMRSVLTAQHSGAFWPQLKAALLALGAFAGAISATAGKIGRFLESSRRTDRYRTMLLRLLSKTSVIVAGLLLPLFLWLFYLWLCASPDLPLGGKVPGVPPAGSNVRLYAIAGLILGSISTLLTPNAYSLHRFYRDRLSKAFLFEPAPAGPKDPPPLDGMKLSELEGTSGPLHIINAAMNLQGSKEANKRGRNADFFMFSRQFVGSDLTFYARTKGGAVATLEMEKADPRLDLATAMAISGAAVSANMGSSTIRILSPMLAMLNVRLGYWIRNPRHLAGRGSFRLGIGTALRRVTEKLFLLNEMLNLATEKDADLLLTDGGHIENLGIYELLKRGCQLIVAIDAEADPEMAFASLLRLERYARIDLGVRIVLPWEAIADASREADAAAAAGQRRCRFGPHCAVGRVIYENGAEGLLVYFKASLTGDEKDYILDYKRRNADFPHETTGDQFFTEEQFENYRALGFHMVNGVIPGADEIACKTKWDPTIDPAGMRAEIDRLLPGKTKRRVLAPQPTPEPGPL